ncbi:MAG: hypothetical protein V2I37_04335 [Marinilabiliaceae bacterium]|jgi:hypothetical protein|nr:hypothetical protein [Marinilabiliaceae bacterium]
MKTLEHFSKLCSFGSKALFLLLVFLISCTKEDIAPDKYFDNEIDMQFKSMTVNEGTVNMEGFTRFAFTAIKEGLVITDGYTMNFLACEAELTFGDNKTFILNTMESFILPDGTLMPLREVSFEGTIGPGGRLIFTWPETWFEMGEPKTDVISQISEHTGSVLHGPGVKKNTLNYKGFYDGEKFFAEMHLTGIQEVPGTLPFFTEVIEGPIAIKFMIDLEVSK